MVNWRCIMKVDLTTASMSAVNVLMIAKSFSHIQNRIKYSVGLVSVRLLVCVSVILGS